MVQVKMVVKAETMVVMKVELVVNVVVNGGAVVVETVKGVGEGEGRW